MSHLIQPSAEDPALEWVAFALFLVLLFACIIGFVAWFKTKRPKSKRKRKHRHHRHHNSASLPPARPTQHELPPKREPNPPPAT